MRIIKYLRPHVGAVLLVFLLLFAQAFCDLLVPRLTSDIVDVGILQQGIDHVALDQMRASTYDHLVSTTDDPEGLIPASYDADGLVYRLNDFGEAHIDELDELESAPLAQLAQSTGVAERYDVTADSSRAPAASEPSTADGSDGETMRQQALAFAASEYSALGLDPWDRQVGYLLREGGKMIAVTLGMGACALLIGLLASRTGAKIARDLRERVFKKVLSFSHRELDRFSTASLITRSTNDIQQVQMSCVMLMRMVLYAPIIGFGGVVMVARTDLSMSWIIALAVAVVICIVIVLFALTMPRFKIMQTLVDGLNLASREMLTGVPVIRAFTREEHEEQRFEQANGMLMRTQLFVGRTMGFMRPMMTVVMNGVSVLIIWVASHQVDLGSLQVGDMIAFITYSTMIIGSFLMLAMVSVMLPRANVAAERIDEVCGTETSIVDPDRPVELAVVGGNPGRQRATLEFDHVGFRYDDADVDVLSDISFTARPGTTTAVIGPTGSGKSTLLNLIPRFHDVTAGVIRVDGVDIRDMRLADLRSLIGFAPQKGTLFSGTIEDNIRFGGEDISEDTMRESARIAQAEEFILAKPNGYDELVSQGGTSVSGGQRQRLSIARALATEAPILLFDDSFSALDYRTDATLRRALRQQLADRTVIIVAQRVATIANADQILVLEEGRVVGCGTHEQLLCTCPTYRQIADSQLSSFDGKEASVG